MWKSGRGGANKRMRNMERQGRTSAKYRNEVKGEHEEDIHLLLTTHKKREASCPVTLSFKFDSVLDLEGNGAQVDSDIST